MVETHSHLKIDSREPKDIIDHFVPLGASKEQLNVGDYIFENDESIVIIERKELSDARKSIQDGRWTDQKKRMNDVRSEEKLKRVCCIILIEGKNGLGLDPWEQYESTSVVSDKMLNHAIINSLVLDSVCILMCQTRKDLIETLEHISNITLDSKGSKRSKTTLGNTPKQKIYMDIFKNQLMLIHGVSGDGADAICKEYKGLYDLFVDIQTHGEKYVVKKVADLVKMESQRKIGQAVATRIVSSFGMSNNSAI